MKLTKTFRNFLLSYLVILLIPNISGFISYRVSIDAAESSSIETSLMMLGQTKSILDRRMAEVEGFTRELGLNRELTALLYANMQNDTDNIYTLWKTWINVSDYGKTNDFLQDYYIYLKNSDVLLSPASVFFRPEHYYELNKYEEMPYEQWKKILLESQQNTILPLRAISRDKNESAVITFVQSLPINSFNQPQGAVVITIDEHKISSLLVSLVKQYGGGAFITDKNGQLLASAGMDAEKISDMASDMKSVTVDSHRFLEDGTLLITTRSEYNGWVYAAQIPKASLMKKATVIRNNTWAVTAFALVVGLIVCWLLAYRNSIPIYRLIGFIREQAGADAARGKNEYDFLQGNIATIITNNKRLEAELTRQLPLLKDAFMKRLIRGEMNSLNEIAASASQIGIELYGPYGYVAIIQINGYGGFESQEIFRELNAVRLIIKQKLDEIGADAYAVTDLESDKIAVVFSYPAEPGPSILEELEKLFEQLNHSVESEYRISTTIAVGSAFQQFSDISRSSEEARQALDYASFKNVGPTIWYDRMTKKTTTYYYPIHLEFRLFGALKSGEWMEAKRISSQIFTENFSERELSAEMAQQLLFEMKGTLLKLLDDNLFPEGSILEELKQQVVAIQPSDSLTQVRSIMDTAMETFCRLIAARRNDTNNETVAFILNYLEEVCGDPEITLYRIAEKAGRPEKYITQLFKEQTGETVTDYLEKIRIGKATELLVHSDLTIDDIAVKVGYNSAHSFRRAFKRVSGVSPSSYRKTTD